VNTDFIASSKYRPGFLNDMPTVTLGFILIVRSNKQ
jgi:hypothetical protein